MIATSLQTTSRNSTVGRFSDAPLVRVDHVGMTFSSGVEALTDVDLHLTPGGFSSIIGPSGCGKSTLLKIIAGLIPPTRGEVVVRDSRIVGPRDEIGMMLQEATLLPWRTALENVLLPVELRVGRKRARASEEEARELLDMVGLSGFETSYPHELSGGMAQRVAICRMLIRHPSILLLDEPFGALDELTRELMNDELQRVCARRPVTSFMVTHSIAEAVYLSDNVFVMSRRPGRISAVIAVDLPRPRTFDMLTEPAFATLVRSVLSELDLGGQM